MNELLVVVFAFLAFMGVHIVLLHLIGPSNFIRNAVFLLIVFLALPLLGIVGKLIFVSLWNMYIFALICSRNSVSLRILDEVLRSPGEALTKHHLLELFSDRESLTARIELMEKGAFLHSVGPDEVELSTKGHLLARGILLARRILGVKELG